MYIRRILSYTELWFLVPIMYDALCILRNGFRDLVNICCISGAHVLCALSFSKYQYAWQTSVGINFSKYTRIHTPSILVYTHKHTPYTSLSLFFLQMNNGNEADVVTSNYFIME
jgi:hypothetical protein